MAAAAGTRLIATPVPASPFAALFGERVARAARRFSERHPWAWLVSRPALATAQEELVQRLLERASAVLLDEAAVALAAGRAAPLPWDPEQVWLGHLEHALTPGAWQQALNGLPLLASLLDRTEADWIAGLGALAQALAEAWPALGPGGPPPVAAIAALRPNLSDPHDGGRTAALVTLHNGTPLIYKPRDLAMEQHFHALVEGLRAHGAADLLRAAPVLHRTPTAGWMPYIEPQPCGSADDVALFFRRAGALLCLVALLQGTDIHRENIIAHGAWPVLVDAETLFQPRRNDDPALSPDDLVRDSGMVPPHGRCTRSDFSALCGRTGTATAIGLPTGAYRLPEAANLPVFAGRAHTGYEHPAQVRAGFIALHRLIVERREALAAAVTAFAEVPGRYVAAGTMRYGMAIAAGLTPQALRTPGLRRDRLRAALTHPLPAVLREQELQALCRADVPRLGFRPGRPGPDGFWAASLDQVMGRLQRLPADGTTPWTAAIDSRLGPSRSGPADSVPLS